MDFLHSTGILGRLRNLHNELSLHPPVQCAYYLVVTASSTLAFRLVSYYQP